MCEVIQHVGKEVRLTRHHDLEALILLIRLNHFDELRHPWQVNRLHLIRVVGNDEGTLGGTTCVFIRRTLVAIGIFHVYQHWREYRVGFHTLFQERQLLLRLFRITADTFSRNKSLEYQAILIGAHVLDLLCRQ